jgi:23S rRNA pseudouridine1911/1915/1917 synthase
MYGGKPILAADGRVIIGRQALHAAVLGFTHPVTGQAMRFTAPLRGDMAEAVRMLRAGSEVRRPAAVGATVDLEQAIG